LNKGLPIHLQLLPGNFAVCRLPASEPVPAWAASTVFSSITRTADELSIICPSGRVPAGVKHDPGWRLLKFQGPFAFNAVGVLASVATPLAAAGVSILAVATFDTDYVLVQSGQLDSAAQALKSAGHTLLRE
jgi:hypothetical protein